MLQWRHLLWLAKFHAYENEAKNMTRREILVPKQSQYTQLIGKGGRSVGSSHGDDERQENPRAKAKAVTTWKVRIRECLPSCVKNKLRAKWRKKNSEL